MTTQNNIVESMLKNRQKTSVSNVNVQVLIFNSTVADFLPKPNHIPESV